MKYDDAPQFKFKMNFSGPGVSEAARNEKPMPDGGDSITLCCVGAAWKVTAAGEAVTGAGSAVTGAATAVTRATGAGAMDFGEDIPLSVTAVLAWPELEPPP